MQELAHSIRTGNVVIMSGEISPDTRLNFK